MRYAPHHQAAIRRNMALRLSRVARKAALPSPMAEGKGRHGPLETRTPMYVYDYKRVTYEQTQPNPRLRGRDSAKLLKIIRLIDIGPSRDPNYWKQDSYD
jgi:hypothetical protein